jgi:hypothetical protein
MGWVTRVRSLGDFDDDGESEMAFGSIDVPTRDIDYFRKVLQDLEAKLAVARARRDEVLGNIRKANAAVDAGDKLARNALPGLNKASGVASRLVLSIEREVAEGKKRLAMAEAQAEAARQGGRADCGRG